MHPRLQRLTKREAEILQWLAQGKTNPAIAEILGIAKGTVNKHVENILTKLHVENRTSAAILFNAGNSSATQHVQ
jgi:DNA-binding NarL/FixJ family response regulator